MKLGIVGGLGPETGCEFCLNLNNRFREKTLNQPDLILANVPVPASVEREIILGKRSLRMRELLVKAVGTLNVAGVDIIAIPCNTVHVFLDQLRNISRAPIMSIIELCAEECAKKGFWKVGILGSATAVKSKMHQKELAKKGIKSLEPGKKDQENLNQIIIRIVRNKSNEKDKKSLLKIIDRLKKQGAEAVILACTDLQFAISEEDAGIQLIDTLEVLETSATKRLLEKV